MNTKKIQEFLLIFAFGLVLLFCGFIGMKYIIPIALPFITAWLFATCINYFSNKLTSKTKVNKSIISKILLLFFYLMLVGLVIAVCSFVVNKVDNIIAIYPTFYENNVKPIINDLYIFVGKFESEEHISLFNNLYTHLTSGIEEFAGLFIKWLGTLATKIPEFIWISVIILIATAFFTVDYDKIKNTAKMYIPIKYQDVSKKFLDSTIKTLPKFLKGYIMVLALTFFESIVFLFAMGIEHYLLISFIIAIVDILPVLGTGAIVLPWSIYSFITGDIGLGICLIIMYTFITVVRQYAEPKIIGDKIGVYPIVTLCAMFVGQQIFGIGGLLGFPIIVAVINAEIKSKQENKSSLA